MPNEISSIFLNSTTYEIKDAAARSALNNVYTKAQTEAAIAEAIGEITGISFEVVQSLPEFGEVGVIYLVPNSGSGRNIYDEYIYLTSPSVHWEKIGTTDVDLSGYALTADLGALAYKDSASVNYTPGGTVGTPIITVTPSTTTVNSITAVGSLPSWGAEVNNEILSFSFDPGTLPTKGNDTTVATGILNASSSQPSFSGTAATITVS